MSVVTWAGPARRAAAITKSDTVGFEVCDGIYVGGAGDAVVIDEEGNSITYVGLAAGTIYPIRAQRVNATGSTATNLVALYSRLTVDV